MDAALVAVAALEAPLVVDVGTGTGAIALSIALTNIPARGWSRPTLRPRPSALARENAGAVRPRRRRARGRPARAGRRTSSAGEVDLVVSNPPYVEPAELEDLPPDVRADPASALVGGIEVFERLFAQAAACLRPGGVVVVEIGDAQGEAVAGAMRAAGFADVRVGPDLTGRDRFVEGRRT